MKLIAVITTVDNMDDAQNIATAAIKSRLAACAQIEEISSIYSWKGQIENTKEIRITFKTTSTRWHELKAQITASHPYEIPAIYSLKIVDVNESYLEWANQINH
ncbi:divalent-cation tolerance protein CutA [Chromatium okenii]|jgi:periplasmic divalent cation tolerance protein|uniref:Cytochrome C biogenesis protein n=1 Tax=Chromatium okenii TaxID=61644 RepID=A0A2S7XQG1_9GAMM|nr:divalent-cation tolerance protein CutA [Chromatium okenii]MBV5309314.1 divalent-cation tolerance protein CutA [Chromatium okenii]PQJ95698.1 cytochrome C biogenesis protein [Chromatium okenii]